MTKPISRQQRIRRWLDKPRLSRMRSIYRSFEGLIETFADAMFDRWHRLDFDGLIQQVDLATDHHASHLNAKHYEAVAGIDLRVIVEEALRVDATIENFIDLGSGKGQILSLRCP